MTSQHEVGGSVPWSWYYEGVGLAGPWMQAAAELQKQQKEAGFVCGERTQS